MRFIMMVRATADSEAGKMPSMELIEAMGRFNEEMVKAGVLLAADGLHPSSKGARVKFTPGARPTVTDGPFTETKELIAGFWMMKVKSREEVISWALRAPSPFGPDQVGEIEIRQVFDPEDFGPEAAENEKALRNELERRTR